jgi:hypothetical protein
LNIISKGQPNLVREVALKILIQWALIYCMDHYGLLINSARKITL